MYMSNNLMHANNWNERIDIINKTNEREKLSENCKQQFNKLAE